MSLCRNTTLGWIALATVLCGCATPKRGDQRFNLQGKSYEQYAKDRYECLERHDRLSYFVGKSSRFPTVSAGREASGASVSS
jgi:hypothetical protein